MDRAHEVRNVTVSGATLRMEADGRAYKGDLTAASPRLASASDAERAQVEVSPASYGLHWPLLDEDLSIDGLIGAKHKTPSLRVNK